MKLHVLQQAGILLTERTVSYSRSTPSHGVRMLNYTVLLPTRYRGLRSDKKRPNIGAKHPPQITYDIYE
jgi:hypothetical protein